MKKVNIDKRKYLYLPNDLRDFNEIFRKNVSYDNIKSHKKTKENAVLQKPQGECQIDPPPLAFLGLTLTRHDLSRFEL